ncbi:MAG: hypothetical protein QM767_28115 [Anaeromyxobacter sp.]
MPKVDWHGVYPAATTQFRSDESIDFDATARHLEVMLKAGIHGLVLLGSVGKTRLSTMARRLISWSA